MVTILITEWIDEFESLVESEIQTYAVELENNDELITALYNVLSEPKKYKSDDLVDKICQQLLQFYRSSVSELYKFAYQFIPSLVFLHLTDRTYKAVQTLLVSLYNIEVIDSKGQPFSISFRIPSVAYPSIYHDPSTLESTFTTENSLRRWEECNTKLVTWGPLPQIEHINAQNRQRVLTALIFLYNRQLYHVKVQGSEFACKGISRLVTEGFQSNSDSSRSSIASDNSIMLSPSSPSSLLQFHSKRIQVSSHLLIELLHLVYNGIAKCANGAVQALHDIIQRAKYENYADVLLMGYAMKDLLKNSHSISVTSRPSNVHSTVSKSMITNASFRTKKLPDDIPIQHDDTKQQQPQLQQPDTSLELIAEEREEESDKTKNKTVSALKHLPKLSGLTKKHKEKNKNVLQQQQQQQQQQSDQNLYEMSSIDGIDSSTTITTTITNTSSCNDTTNCNNSTAVHVSAV